MNTESVKSQTLLLDYRKRLSTALSEVPDAGLLEFCRLLVMLRANGGRGWFCGNGGSASTSDHFEVDLSLGVSPPIPAISLSSNSSGITATGNDFSFEDVFARQITSFSSKNDLVVVISASGNSPNLLKAVQAAKALDLVTVGILGFDGGKLKSMVDLPVFVRTEIGDYGVAEDVHLAINHMVKEVIKSWDAQTV